MTQQSTESTHQIQRETIHNVKQLMDNSSKWKWISLIFIISTCAFVVTSISVWVIKDLQIEAISIPSCRTDNKAFRKHRWDERQKNPFTALTPSEIEMVADYLHTRTDLNLKQPDSASIDSSFIHTIELQPPIKKDVIRYLDDNGSIPVREAKVFIFRGDVDPPVIQEYVVGYLPNISYANVINTSSRLTEIPYHLRPFSSFEFMAIYKFVIARVHKMAGHILKESYNATSLQCGDQCLRFSMAPISSGFLKAGERKSWFWFAHDVQFHTLHPLDFQFLVDHASSDPTKWKIQTVFYAKQLFVSLEDFIDQYRCKPINKTRIPFPSQEEERFSSLQFREPLVPKENQRPPHQYEPDGSRINVLGNAIKYLSWDINFRMSSTVGLQLFNVQFGGERFLYELSMQEVIVTYSGFSPAGQVLNYADSAGLFGTRCRGLLPSVDCPDTAHFIDTYLYSANEGGFRTYQNAMCLFEHTTNTPVRRHRAYGRSGAFYGGLVNTALVVRTIISVINYDYIVDIFFYQSGAIQVKVSLTGYISSTFYYPEEEHYGAHIHKNIIGGLHNHLFHFKVDLDVKGTKNTFESLDIKVENKTDMWSGEQHSQSYLERNVRKNEQDALVNYNFSDPKYLLMSSYSNRTKEGLPRSYRIYPIGMSKQLLPSGYGFTDSISWAEHQVVVTRRKDNEETSSSIFSMWDAANPVVNFRKYYEDNENIEDEDLVAWVTLGTQHIPHNENLPNTLTIGATPNFYLIPYNFFDEDQSMKSRDAVYVTPSDVNNPTGGATVKRYNRKDEKKCSARVVLPDKELEHDSRFLFS